MTYDQLIGKIENLLARLGQTKYTTDNFISVDRFSYRFNIPGGYFNQESFNKFVQDPTTKYLKFISVDRDHLLIHYMVSAKELMADES